MAYCKTTTLTFEGIGMDRECTEFQLLTRIMDGGFFTVTLDITTTNELDGAMQILGYHKDTDTIYEFIIFDKPDTLHNMDKFSEEIADLCK